MGIIKEILGLERLTSKDLKSALLRVERDRRKAQREMKKLDQRQGRLVEQIKTARKSGDALEVDYRWEELKAIKLDRALSAREATVLNLESITVKKYLHGLERLERKKDRTSIDSLLQRIRSSGLEAKLAAEQIRTTDYLDELRAILEDSGLESGLDDYAADDPEKASFLDAIDAINSAEEQGDLASAGEREQALKQKLVESPDETERP